MPEFSPLTGATTTGRPFSVFLSHSMRDTEHVEVVQRQLEALGISAWLAGLDPRPGGSVLEKIESVLPKSDAIVFLITTNSIDSAYVHQEIGLARAHGVPMVPLVDHRVDKSRLGLLAELEWIGIDLEEPAEALAAVTRSLQPLVLHQVQQRASELNQTSAPSDSGAIAFDPTVALLVLGLGVAIAVLLNSYSIKIEIGLAGG